MFDVLTERERIGMQKGVEQGIEQGIRLGEEKVAKLMRYLFDHGLYDEAQEAADHPEKLEEYFVRYGIV